MSAEIKEFLSKENLVEYHQIIKDKIDDMTPSNIGVFVDKDEWVLNEEKGKYFNAIPIPGIDESCYPVIGIAPADGESPTEEEIDAYDHITDIITTEGYLTLWCTVKPTTSITIVIKDDLATGGTLIANYSAMVDKINKLETKISELTNNLSTMKSVNSTVGKVHGGYTVNGSIVTVSIVITLTSNVLSNSDVIVSGLPVPIAGPVRINAYNVNAGSLNDSKISSGGKLYIYGDHTSGQHLAFNGSYLK